MESLSFEGGGRIHKSLLFRHCFLFSPLCSDCGNGGCLSLWDLLQDARGLHTIPGRGPQMLLSPGPQEPNPALTFLTWTESWETQNLAREGRNESGCHRARCSKSRSPRGHSPTTAPPDALTSCSTSPGVCPRRHSHRQLKARNHFCLPATHAIGNLSSFWRTGIGQISLSGNKLLGVSFVHASRF